MSKHELGLRRILEQFVGVSADDLTKLEKNVVAIANDALDRPHVIVNQHGDYVHT